MDDNEIQTQWAPAVGSEVKIKTINEKSIIGEVYTVDPVTSSLVIRKSLENKRNKYEMHIIPKAAVAEIEVVKEGTQKFDTLPALSATALDAAEQKALDEASERIEKLNVNASPEGQALFDALCKTLPCAWVGEAIQVLDQVRIDPPYTKQSCVSLDGSDASLKRIVKMVEGIKQKISRQKPNH
mmetsp:Transcript_20137/g.26025  ORF Transcript_20137/g.26025 Transcript_20137/m.26025 type:complete len:184 (+) Transcript_20137:45-596(+)